MNIQPTNLQQPEVSNTDSMIIGLLAHNGATAEFVEQPNGRGLVVYIQPQQLEKLRGLSHTNLEGAKAFITSMLYPFQEMSKMVRSGSITGFAILPAKEFIKEPWAHLATDNFGRILQSLCDGQIALR